jgi:exodeoxyribonuclease V beta subunit
MLHKGRGRGGKQKETPMNDFHEFQLLESPLEGTNLIEASAGTGKTYTITGLFLRLLLEKNFAVKQILVVTFTEAATQELKDRIRRSVREALEAFSRGAGDDPFLDSLVKKHKDRARAITCLREALHAFDEAAVYTIHGFCRRMLRENAFESGSLFDTELLTDESLLSKEIVDDFWRKHFYSASPRFVRYALRQKFKPEKLLDQLPNKTNLNRLRIVPDNGPIDFSAREKSFLDAWAEIREAWISGRDEIAGLLVEHEGFNKNKYSPQAIAFLIHGMDTFVTYGQSDPWLFPGLIRFAPGNLKEGMRKNHEPPDHAFFHLCEKGCKALMHLEQAFDTCLLSLKVRLYRELEEEFARRKREKNVQSFEDLLVNLQRALEGQGGEVLAEAIRKKYRAALIDEFQDTDPVQYRIFKQVFGKEGSVLFLVGDPKQAIYGFRGADIFAYMEASREVARRYTLDENWRSAPGLIEAVNALFSRSERPFVFEKIRFQKARAAREKEVEQLEIDGWVGSPFQVWYLDAQAWAKPGSVINKGDAEKAIPKAVAAEIAHLLNLGQGERALIKGRPLQAGDIAVLVRRNKEAKMVRQALAPLGVPSLLYSEDNLFDTREAVEMERILKAFAEPTHEGLMMAALATDVMGRTAEEMDHIRNDEGAWEAEALKFRKYYELWQDRGFIRMFRSFVTGEGVLARLMVLPDGERRSTNLLHLMEVLHQASVDRKLNRIGLLKWLAEQRDPATPRVEEHQLRLESDENAVNLVTIHKSKGLEYPVVFCPFSWNGSKLSGENFSFHDKAHHMGLTLDVGSPQRESHRLVAEREVLAENLRLLYVALTRAKCRCYLVWGRIRDSETSAPAYLLYPPSTSDDEVGATEKRVTGLDDEAMLSTTLGMVNNAGGTLKLLEQPLPEGEEYSVRSQESFALSCKEFRGKIDRGWKISSFSSVVSKTLHGEEPADRDSLPESEEEEIQEREEATGIFAFPQGTKAGTCLHALFERLDFMEEDPDLVRTKVGEALRSHGYAETWDGTILGMVQKVLSVPLAGKGESFSLNRVAWADRLNELEFTFRLKSMDQAILGQLLEKEGLPADNPSRIGRLDFAPVRGFVRGFIDLVFRFGNRFYLVDWKSNFLGSKIEDYDQTSLARAMAEGYYILQYHLYTLALNQYLRLRVPNYEYERHFGAVFYIFLRGVDPARGSEYGIYRARPGGAWIDEVTEKLIGKES